MLTVSQSLYDSNNDTKFNDNLKKTKEFYVSSKAMKPRSVLPHLPLPEKRLRISVTIPYDDIQPIVTETEVVIHINESNLEDLNAVLAKYLPVLKEFNTKGAEKRKQKKADDDNDSESSGTDDNESSSDSSDSDSTDDHSGSESDDN